MWIRVDIGNHFGLFDVMGVEMYREDEDSFILYGYLPKPIPLIPVGIDRGLRSGEMTHQDFVKLYEYTSEEACRRELDKIQAFLDEGGTGVYVIGEPGTEVPRFGTFG